MSKLPPPPNNRPYRQMFEAGPELVVYTDTARLDLRQVGWLGQTGAFYSLDEKPHDHEPGGMAPLYFPAHSDRLDDLLDPGEAARQAAGIDGTAGDAQDVPHSFVIDKKTGGCLVCGLAPSYRKHNDNPFGPAPRRLGRGA